VTAVESPGTSTALVTGVDFVVVPTRDFEQAVEFYGTILGLEKSKRWGDSPAQEFDTGNLTLAVVEIEFFGTDFSPHRAPIALRVDDVPTAGQSWSRAASSSRETSSTAASATRRSSRTWTATSSTSTTATRRLPEA
jgi:catechol 2,3-dioxygenase-like lactoylglutathione lyase family enzyme